MTVKEEVTNTKLGLNVGQDPLLAEELVDMKQSYRE